MHHSKNSFVAPKLSQRALVKSLCTKHASNLDMLNYQLRNKDEAFLVVIYCYMLNQVNSVGEPESEHGLEETEVHDRACNMST